MKTFICNRCGKKIPITGSKEQWDEYYSRARNIQDIFPELSPDDREVLLSGICGECFSDYLGGQNENI